VLGLRAEREYPVHPLPWPDHPAGMSLAEIAASPAVALFVDRARAVRPGFALTEANAAVVVEICRLLEGLPLAIELAAARTRLMDPAALLARLVTSLDALGTGPADLPERQHTLRATVEWSVGLLDDAERSLLEVAAVFADGWTVEAVAEVAGLNAERALALTEALARHSLVQLDPTPLGPRPRMLDTVREFVAERLAARRDAADIGRRHALYYLQLAEQADRPLRGGEWPLRGGDQTRWLERLQPEAGNLAAAVRWYLAHDRGPLPHLFRVLWPFWALRDYQSARPWLEQMLPESSSLDPQARAELLWTAAITAIDTGDDAAAQQAAADLKPLLDEIRDPFLRAVSELVIAWSSTIDGDFDEALREAAESLDQLRHQDEPLFTVIAAFTVGSMETDAGRYQDARRHLREASDLAGAVGIPWFIAGSRVRLGVLDVLGGRLDQARTALDEALELSLATHSTAFVTLSLVGQARLALAEGNPQQAALLEGAAAGLRRRAGLQAWPMLRKGESELASQVSRALGVRRFNQAFADGAELNQRDVAAVLEDRHALDAQAS
jgi:predicted ATPase